MNITAEMWMNKSSLISITLPLVIIIKIIIKIIMLQVLILILTKNNLAVVVVVIIILMVEKLIHKISINSSDKIVTLIEKVLRV